MLPVCTVIRSRAATAFARQEADKSYLNNDYLHFGYIQAAAIAREFKIVAVGYYRNIQLVAYRMENLNNPDRQEFIAWAVKLLRSHDPAPFSQEELLNIFASLLLAERSGIAVAVPSARNFSGVAIDLNRAAPGACISSAIRCRADELGDRCRRRRGWRKIWILCRSESIGELLQRS
jgi:hypothetical protein